MSTAIEHPAQQIAANRSGLPRVFLARLNAGCQDAVARAVRFLLPSERLRPGACVVLKPNLTFPHPKPGVTTSPEAVEAALACLADLGCKVTVCESDSGGYNPFSMDAVFEATGLRQIAARYGARLVNLSGQPVRKIAVRCGLKTRQVPIPSLLMDETDLFITMPVPKVHVNTVVSGAIKNQWGLIPHPHLRLQLHPWLPEVLHAIHQALPPTWVLMDGRYGLNRSGPMRGDPVELNWLLASDDVLAADLAMVKLLGVDWRNVRHLVHFSRQPGAARWNEIRFNTDYEQFLGPRFFLRRTWTDAPGWLAFHSRGLAWLAYESFLSRALHRLLYLFREPFY